MSNLDRATRIDGMRRNWFVHRQVPLPSMADAVQARQLSTLFDRARLKSPAQMLASEGVVATFFYRQLVPPPGQEAGLQAGYAAIPALSRAPCKAAPGNFRSIHDFVERAGLGPDGTPALETMAQAGSRLGPNMRE